MKVGAGGKRTTAQVKWLVANSPNRRRTVLVAENLLSKARLVKNKPRGVQGRMIAPISIKPHTASEPSALSLNSATGSVLNRDGFGFDSQRSFITLSSDSVKNRIVESSPHER